MPKTFTDLARHNTLNGPTMGTRWSALFHMPGDFETTEVHAAMADAVAEVDRQMSIWKPESDLNSLNAAAPGVPVPAPIRMTGLLLCKVRKLGLERTKAVTVCPGSRVDSCPEQTPPGCLRTQISRNPR